MFMAFWLNFMLLGYFFSKKQLEKYCYAVLIVFLNIAIFGFEIWQLSYMKWPMLLIMGFISIGSMVFSWHYFVKKTSVGKSQETGRSDN